MKKEQLYLKKQVFFNWYFTHRTKEQVAAFISPYFLNLIKKEARFGLKDLLNNAESVPSHLLENSKGKSNELIDVKHIKLID